MNAPEPNLPPHSPRRLDSGVIAHPVTRWLALGFAITGLIYHALIFDFE